MIEAYLPTNYDTGLGTSRIDNGFITSFETVIEKLGDSEGYKLENGIGISKNSDVNNY